MIIKKFAFLIFKKRIKYIQIKLIIDMFQFKKNLFRNFDKIVFFSFESEMVKMAKQK